MDYNETLDWMFSKLPMYQRQGATAFKKDLSNSIAFSAHLGKPHTQFKSIHIAGTNGKGSTSHMLASILQEANYKVGLYTSPHLKDFRERIKINGRPISKNTVTSFIEKNRSFLELNRLSFFEMTVGMAFKIFADQKVDIAIVEVGLGGRLDSTNIIKPEISVITNIGLDHTQFLGDTLTKIAYEKAGIIKENVPVIIGEKQDDLVEVFQTLAKKNNTELIFASQLKIPAYKSDLHGNYQEKNIKTAIASIRVLRKRGFKISKENCLEGLLNVNKNTGLKGRWQILQHKPLVICDTAHNKEGLTLVLAQLSTINYKKLHIVLGTVNDKELEGIFKLFPKEASYYFCKPSIIRGLEAKILKVKALKFGLKGNAYDSVKNALDSAKNEADKDDLIFVGGSTFVVAEVV